MLFFVGLFHRRYLWSPVRLCVFVCVCGKKKKDTLKGEESSAFVQGWQIILLLLLLPLSTIIGKNGEIYIYIPNKYPLFKVYMH